MKRVAWLTGAAWRGKAMAPGQLPEPDAIDFALVEPLAAAAGIAFEIARWDDPELLARGFEAYLVRSCWDYTQRVEAFEAALGAIEATDAPLFNPLAVVRWNGVKTYLRALGEAGAPVIPTHWPDAITPGAIVAAFDAWEAAEIVAKPQVGAGSRDTIRLKRNAWSEADLIHGPKGPAMLQPFLPAIQDSGELSLFFFGGRLSHVVRKTPAPGDWYANTGDARFAPGEADGADLAAASAALAAAPKGMLYARVDLVRGGDGQPRVIELEAIEPYLFLRFAPDAAPAAFVAALAGALA